MDTTALCKEIRLVIIGIYTHTHKHTTEYTTEKKVWILKKNIRSAINVQASFKI